MYNEIFEKYQKEFPGFPATRRPLVGSVIKEIRVDKGIRQMDFAEKTGINESTLKSIENDHQQATTVENLQRCAKELGLLADEIILAGRERDPANYFVLKRSSPPPITGIRKRKRAPEEWHQSIRLRFESFDITPISPPLRCRKDFFVARVILPPKRSMDKLSLGTHTPVIGFVAGGFNVKISYADVIFPVTTNQGFSFDGFYPHKIMNNDDDQAAIIYLVTKLPASSRDTPPGRRASKESTSINISQGIERLRGHCSDRPDRALAVKHLADLTDHLDHEQITKMMRMKKGSSVVYWEKIEDLLGGAGVTMEDFLAWSKYTHSKPFSVATAMTRAMVDYTTYHGVKIYSAVPPQTGNQFFCGEFFVEGKQTLARKSWERKDNAMIALYVEEGMLEVAVGKRRGPLPILKGESVYFDGNMEYALRNPETAQVKGFLATFPAIQI